MPITLPRDHPRLGGWGELAQDQRCRARLAQHSAWAAERLADLIELENEGLALARGDSLAHFDLYPHNILLTSERVLFVDWPHARLGAPIIDLVMLLCSAAADGIDPEPFLCLHGGRMGAAPGTIDAVLAANAGFLLVGGLLPAPPGLEPIAAAKLHLGMGALGWLKQRLGARQP